MAEVAPSGGGGGGNRTFLLIIGGLGALLVIAMLALGAIFVLPGLLGGGGQIASIVTPSPTRIVIPNTPTRTAQPSPTLVVVAQITTAATATETQEPLMTATAIPITATPIMITATPEPGSQQPDNALPDSGLGEDLLLLFGGGILLLGVIVIVRRMRTT
jgi:carbohydrate-binding DOMON domain-containing protein